MRRIAIVGAGQLGQMLGFAARKLDAECVFLDPNPDPPAAAIGEVIHAQFDDAAALARMAAKCDVLTYEFENVPVAAMEDVARNIAVYPPPAALSYAQDRLSEKQLFQELGIPLPGYYPIDTRDDLETAASVLGLPLVVKTRRLGYDGKGQCVARCKQDLDSAWQALGNVPLIAEQWVAFDYEVSCIGVRSTSGEVVMYPLSRNTHVDGILRTSRSPIDAARLTEQAVDYVQALLRHLNYSGVLALELFVVGDTLLANEFAPRVHNSGHWTIEGSATSQFENHLRAILGVKLGATTSHEHAGMINLIGSIPDALRTSTSGHLHDYGKRPREGRKVGHFTVTSGSASECDALVEKIGQSVTQSASESENAA